MVCGPIKQVRQELPVPDADLGQCTAFRTTALNPIIPIAKLSFVGRVFRPEPRARTSSELPLHEFAFDSNPFTWSTQENIYICRPGFVQNAYFMFKFNRPAGPAIEKRGSATFRGYVVKQVETIESANRAEHALGQRLRTFQTAEPPMPVAGGNRRPDFSDFAPTRRNQDTFSGELLRKNRWTIESLAVVKLTAMVLIGPGP